MRAKLGIPVILAAAMLGAAPVRAADATSDRLIAQLTQQGFSRFEVSRTLLGRIRIEAHKDGLEREIIFNPRTGEILRDYWNYGSIGSPLLFDSSDDGDGGGGGGQQSGGNDDDDSEDDEDDEEDEQDERDERDDRGGWRG